MASTGLSEIDVDMLYEQAARHVALRGVVTCCALQRHLRIGHSLALHLKERLERERIACVRQATVEPERIETKMVLGLAAKRGMTIRTMSYANNDSKDDKSIICDERHDRRGTEQRVSLDRELSGAHVVFVMAAGKSGVACERTALVTHSCTNHAAMSIVVAGQPDDFGSHAYGLEPASGPHAPALLPDVRLVLPGAGTCSPRKPGSAWIRRLTTALSRSDPIRVGLDDFRYAMTGNIVNGGALVKLHGCDASGPDRAVDASSRLLANPALLAHLAMADGLFFNIASNPMNLMGREVKHICAAIRRHVGPQCEWVGSIHCDQTMPPGMLRVDLLASRWGT